MSFYAQLGISAAVVAVGSYLLGSISFSIIFAKIFIKEDIRTMGSGNAGTTNVLRSVGKKAAALTFLFDALKCVAAIVPTRFFFLYLEQANTIDPQPSVYVWAQWAAYLAGFFCMIGHIYPVYFKFKGGKGVVTLATTAALVDWRVFLICLGVFVIVFFASRMVSLCSIVGAASYPVATFCMTFFVDYRMGITPTHYNATYVIVATAVTLICAIVIIAKHHTNIKRIAQGTEKKISFHKKKSEA
ncbi:MAG: glycerol-3-phosphate 1-O-acyltransferase PlsY [Clostridiales bacterium]|jgi:glycerol-3-phosphate acyltransferase PlsY|nr:glycerol-3-phosphate 1-O-acyltransferase PlsY [Clostridiales bacterium]